MWHRVIEQYFTLSLHYHYELYWQPLISLIGTMLWNWIDWLWHWDFKTVCTCVSWVLTHRQHTNTYYTVLVMTYNSSFSKKLSTASYGTLFPLKNISFFFFVFVRLLFMSRRQFMELSLENELTRCVILSCKIYAVC